MNIPAIIAVSIFAACAILPVIGHLLSQRPQHPRRRLSRGEWITGMHGLGYRIFVAWLALGWLVLIPVAIMRAGS